LRRVLHAPAQRINRIFFRGIAKADLVLVAGGERTRNSLLKAGCPAEKIVASVDCGVRSALLDLPRVRHTGENYRFIHYGRLVLQKGTFLAIEGVAKAKCRVCLDIVGKGPELDRCQRLTRELGLEDRVHFLGWYTSHAELLDSFKNYRGAVFPSFQDANGIVVQEAMAVGLPMICLDWGGPQLLIDNEKTGYLIEPRSEGYITDQIAVCLDQLGQDGDLAENMSKMARDKAESWRWSIVMREWIEFYAERLKRRNVLSRK
jgi:glycosyltransferase involved in cell wall biosynthesis